MKECLLCDNECGSASHVLWECPAIIVVSGTIS